MTIIAQLAETESITAQAIGLAFPDVPGFKGQGWSTQETVMVVRWLFANPAAWDQAMDVARKYPENPHTVADTLHETIVPRSELDAIAAAGGDPARVNWLEIGHELIERRDDPRPVSLAAELARPDDPALPPEAAGQLTRLVPADAIATSMLTAHAVDDTGHHLSHASQRLDAAGEASGDLRSHHLEHCARHLDDARQSAHDLAGNLRASYPDEGAELGKLTQAIGLARAVGQDAKTATLAHLTETAGHHLGHTIRHVQAMRDDPDPETSEFNAGHARKHLNGAREHVAKLADHLRDNYPAEGGFLAGLGGAGAGAEDGGGISAQMSGPVTVSAQSAETN